MHQWSFSLEKLNKILQATSNESYEVQVHEGCWIIQTVFVLLHLDSVDANLLELLSMVLKYFVRAQEYFNSKTNNMEALPVLGDNNLKISKHQHSHSIDQSM